MNRTIKEYQDEIWPWALKNFGDVDKTPPVIAAVGLGEETGEVLRAFLKDWQQIRGTHAEWMEEAKKELGDVFIKIIEVGARAGFDMEEVLAERWASIRVRDWVKDRQGHGIEKS